MRAPKEVVLIDRRTWEIIQRYTSASAASEDTGVDVMKIYSSANEKQFSRSSLYCLRYADDCSLEDEPKKLNTISPLRVTDTQTDKTTEYVTTLAAAKALNAASATLTYCCNNGTLYKHRYKIERIEVAI